MKITNMQTREQEIRHKIVNTVNRHCILYYCRYKYYCFECISVLYRKITANANI